MTMELGHRTNFAFEVHCTCIFGAVGDSGRPTGRPLLPTSEFRSTLRHVMALLTSEVQKRQHKVTPPRPGGVRTSAGCHDPPPGPGGGFVLKELILDLLDLSVNQ